MCSKLHGQDSNESELVFSIKEQLNSISSWDQGEAGMKMRA